MSEQHNRGSAGARPALVIDGEAMVIARHPRAKPSDESAWRAPAPDAAEAARAAFGRARPQPARRRKPPTADLIFQTAPKQRFALPAEQRASVLPRAAWIAGLMTLSALVPLAVLSVYGSVQRGPAETVAAATPAEAPKAEKPVRILYGTPSVPDTRLAFAGDSRPATLPGELGGVYPVSAGTEPAGVARLGSVRGIPNRQAARRIELP